MADLPSILGGMAQGFVDFGKGAVDLFGTGGAAIGDLVDTIRTGKVSTKNQDDFRKWLYNTDSVKDAAAKGLGTALNGVQTALDYIPGVNAFTRNPLGNAAQGALGGLADEFKTYGENYDLGRAGQRAAVSGLAAAASGSLADALKGSGNALLKSGTAQGLARGATSGAISGGGYAAIDGGDVLQGALQGAGTGALIGGATGAFQDFKPAKTYDMALTDDERAARIANAQQQIDDLGPIRLFTDDPDELAKRARVHELQDTIKAYQSGYDTVQDYNDALAARRANRQPSLTREEYEAKMQQRIRDLGGNYEVTPEKQAQFDRLQKVNPMLDDYHTGIRAPQDIATLQEAINNAKDIDPAYKAMLQKALADDSVTVYSSYPIEEGVFTTPIKQMAQDYAGPGNQVYSKTISPNDIAWIDDQEGNYLPRSQQLEATLADADMAVNSPRYLTDENGNPRTFYHGSPNKNITEFDINQAGRNTSSGERALYFTDSPEVADEFSYERLPSDSMFIDNRGAKGRVYPVNLEMNNPLDLDNLTDAQIRELWQYASPLGQLDGQEKFIKNLTEFRDAAHNGQLTKTLLDLDKLANSPYDGFTARMYPNQADQAREYAVFDNSKVKMLEDAPDIMESRMAPEGFTYDYDGSDEAAVQRAYNMATQDQEKLDGMLKEISDSLGTEFSSAGQKSMESMLNKVDRKVRAGKNYTVASMKDHTRGKIMMNDFSEIPRVLEELESRGVPYETEVVTNDWGYKGYHITFRNPDGISSEIQLTTADHWPAKLKSDAIYDKWRNVNLGTASEAERRGYNEAMAESQALWAKVDFNEFDKAAQLSSGTGRASRSVAPVTSKSGLTQEPSLYKNTPLPSESANMSPSSVTRTFSGLGFDKSPNINEPPFGNIIPQNASRTLEGVLSADDAAVNGVMESRVAPGQLGLFDDMPTQTPKTGTRQTSLFDQPQEGVDYYGGDIEPPVTEPTNPYAPVDGQVTQAMRDRAADILGNWKKNGVPENELYNAINPDTLPLGYKEAINVLDNMDAKKYLKDNLGVTDIKKAKFDKVLDYLFGDNEDAKRARMEMRDQQIESAKQKAKLLGLPGPSKNFVPTVEAQLREEVEYKMAKDISKSLRDISVDAQTGEAMPLTARNLERLDPKKHSFRTGYTAAADEAFSERLGIAPGNTPKYNGRVDVRGAYGRYSHPAYGVGGDLAVFERKMDNPEDAISSVAHERLHSFQNETTNSANNAGRYSKEVENAFRDLRKDLEKHYKSWDETAKRYGGGRGNVYWNSAKEQEARMLETYLQNKGYTDAPGLKNKYRAGEWGNEINPAFDKFFDKLRDLSKRGIALPALTALFGGGAYMASQNNDKEKEVK